VSKTPSWQRLCDYGGLSEYEAKLYVSLIMEGPSKARQLSMRCGIPRTKVYGTLKKLIERGLVIVVPEEPGRYMPASPADAFDEYLRSYEEKTRSLLSTVSLLEEAYDAAKTAVNPKKGEVWILQGRSRVLRKVGEMLSRAERLVDVKTSENGLIALYKANPRLLDRLKERGVRVQVSAPDGPHSHNLLRELRYICHVEPMDIRLPILFVCADGTESLLASLSPDDLNTASDGDIAVFTSNPTLSELVSALLLNTVAKPPEGHRPLKPTQLVKSPSA